MDRPRKFYVRLVEDLHNMDKCHKPGLQGLHRSLQ